jgi:type I restriction enzyme S subunit
MKKNKLQKNIPNGWIQVRLGDICVFKKGKGLPKSDLADNGKYEAIHYGELFTKYNEKICVILSSTNDNKNVFLSKKNDILMPTSDVTPRGLSTASFIDKDGVILGGDILVIRPKTRELNGLFFSNFVTAQKKEIIRLVSGTTVFHLYGSDMAKLKFNMPPLPEQKQIVSVLETWDEMVETLARKIEIKKNIKKGLMQELLSGKKRLSGFTDEWVTVKLGDICKRESSNIAANLLENNEGDYKIYGASGLLKKINFYQQDEFYISIVKDGAGVGRLFLCEPKTSTLGTLDNLKVNGNNNLLFLYSLLQKIEFRKYIVGSTIPHIYFKDYKIEKVNIPKDIKEQKAIADILVMADREIEKLEEKLRIIKEQKKFLLNNLITGQIRVPEKVKI